jgi:serine protease Do
MTPLALAMAAVKLTAGAEEVTPDDRASAESGIQRSRAYRAALAVMGPRVVRIEVIGAPTSTDVAATATVVTTGLALDEGGLVLTSDFGGAGGAASLVVVTPDGQRQAAEVVARDGVRRLLLLRCDSPVVAAAPLRVAPAPRVGETALALGRVHALGDASLHVGVVSAIGRLGIDAIQTDADTSPANYGGPLVNLRGELLGLVAPLAPAGQKAEEWYDSGIGFAAAWPEVARRLPTLASGVSIEPGFAGLGFPADDPLRSPAEVVEVDPQGAGAAAGIAVGDLLVAIDGVRVTNVHDAKRLLGGHDAGAVERLDFDRGGVRRTATIEFAASTKKPGGR